MLHDVFICHASEDKDDFVRPLAEALRASHLSVWYDEFALTVGESLRETIDRGLSTSEFGVVVVSPHFFQKPWAQRELSGLVLREIYERRRVVLPIWHNVNMDDVLRQSPPLADVFAIASSRGINAVVTELLKKLRPEVSPLVVARDALIDKGWDPPVISDEWWLDMVELMEGQYRFPDLNMGHRWIFPLPFEDAKRGRERGLNIAFTALQLDWSKDAEESKISQLTHPEQVHAFLRKWPGLKEACEKNPDVLAIYAPQLTLPGFERHFADAFDRLLDQGNRGTHSFRYGRSDTIDDGEPLCGEFIAWRHPTFGNYTAKDVANTFVNGHNGSYSRSVFSGFECLTWLLSDDSLWLPERLRVTLINGMRTFTYHWFNDLLSEDNEFAESVLLQTRSKFRFTRKLRSSLSAAFSDAAKKLKLQQDTLHLTSLFSDLGFATAYYDERDEWKKRREEFVQK